MVVHCTEYKNDAPSASATVRINCGTDSALLGMLRNTLTAMQKAKVAPVSPLGGPNAAKAFIVTLDNILGTKNCAFCLGAVLMMYLRIIHKSIGADKGPCDPSAFLESPVLGIGKPSGKLTMMEPTSPQMLRMIRDLIAKFSAAALDLFVIDFLRRLDELVANNCISVVLSPQLVLELDMVLKTDEADVQATLDLLPSNEAYMPEKAAHRRRAVPESPAKRPAPFEDGRPTKHARTADGPVARRPSEGADPQEQQQAQEPIGIAEFAAETQQETGDQQPEMQQQEEDQQQEEEGNQPKTQGEQEEDDDDEEQKMQIESEDEEGEPLDYEEDDGNQTE